MLKLTVLLLGVALYSASANAAPGDLLKFFSGLDGHWTGSGTVTQTDFNGRRELQKYTSDLTIDDQRDGLFRAHQELEFDNNITQNGDIDFQVREDLLFVSIAGVVDPVGIREVSPTKVVYTYQRFEYWSGRVYTFVNTLETPAANRLLGHTQIELNGQVISDDRFEVRK